MKKILVATHGRLASGVKSVAEVLLHDDSAITVVDCYVDESDPNEQIALDYQLHPNTSHIHPYMYG